MPPVWKPSTVPKSTAPQIMAEPQHRIGSEGVTSGLSMRALPSACVAEVRKICQHYVRKTSGKYTDNVTAARYIHQMSEEVLSQLADVAAEIKRHESSPEIFQQLLDDWNEVFPPSLGDIGTPKAIASKLKSQALQIDELQEQRNELLKKRDTDLKGVISSMDLQLQACRDSVSNERRQLLFQHATEIADLNERIRKLSLDNEEQIKSLGQTYKSTIDTLKTKFKKLEAAKDGEVAEAAAKFASREKELLDRMAQLASEKQALSDSLKAKARERQENVRSNIRRPSFVPERRVSLPSTNSIASSVQSDPIDVEDTFEFDLDLIDEKNALVSAKVDVESEEEEEDEEEEEEEESESSEEEDDKHKKPSYSTFSEDMANDFGLAISGDNRGGGKKAKKKPKKVKKAKKAAKVVTPAPTVSLRGAVAHKLAAMTTEIKMLTQVNTAREEDMKIMQEDIDKLLVELRLQKRRADGLEEANSALRRTIAAGIQNKEEPAIRMKVPVTTHTPHFLQHTRSEPHCNMY